MAPSVLLMLALAAPAASVPHNFSTGERPSTALLRDAGTASVRSVIRNVGARQLDAAGLASVQAAANIQRTAMMGTAQLNAAGLASVQAAAKNPSPTATPQARDNGGIVQAGGIAPRASEVSFANGTATTVSLRMPAGLAAPTSNTDTPSTTTPATGAAPSTVQTPGTDTLSEAGRIAVDASVAALRAAAVAMRSRSGTAPGLATVGDPDAHYARGVEALRAKDSHTAIAELSACVQAAPSRADCRWELGWAYSVDGRWSDSLAQWTQVRTLKPDQPDLESALTQARNQAVLQARLAQPVDGTPRPPPPPGAKVRIRATGDLMLGTTVPEGYLPPEGGGSVIASVRPLLEDADLTFVNLEGPLCDTGRTTKCRSPANCYAFRSPTSFGQYIKDAGVDVVSTANNHSGDFGEECRRATESTLDALGIAWSGPPGSVATLERNGLKIGLVAFHTSAGCNHLNNLPNATALVKQVAATHDIVVVSFHGGAEGGKALHVPEGKELFFGEDRGDLRAFTHAVVDAGAHLVLGHGPHVARAMEFYQGRLIAYSMGNFATYGRFNLKGPQGLGMVLEVELDSRGRFSTGRILPTKQVGEGIAQPDPDANVVSLVRKLSNEDFPDTGARIADDGRLSPRKAPITAAGSAP
ncbi:CapA family protein [Corallococcus sp. CA053C]|uniref:CapA family protein n=1 Tax=Corallococcus sp. CA053C TaxID=2316732 RepID=UPI000EA2852D|nr:CapA family protein [Corallococcus sp. CA053C]RKG99289.1 CapA family protein [Corallococcus sp. CA053C]